MLRDEDTSAGSREELPDRLDSLRLKGCRACRSGSDRRIKVSGKFHEICESNCYTSGPAVTRYVLALRFRERVSSRISEGFLNDTSIDSDRSYRLFLRTSNGTWNSNYSTDFNSITTGMKRSVGKLDAAIVKKIPCFFFPYFFHRLVSQFY